MRSRNGLTSRTFSSTCPRIRFSKRFDIDHDIRELGHGGINPMVHVPGTGAADNPAGAC